jgi:hypothetical protein
MASRLDIPQTQQQAIDTGGILIRTVAAPLVISKLYTIPEPRKPKDDDYDGNVPQLTKDASPYSTKSMLGTDVMSSIRIKGYTELDVEGNVIPSFDITLETVLINVALQKNIVKTPVQGLNNNVKEYISDNDFAIRIQGIITGDPNNGWGNGVYPRQEMEDFINFIKQPVPVAVSSWYLQMYDIQDIVLFYAEMDQMPGEYSMQRFMIQAYSDKPIQLKF